MISLFLWWLSKEIKEDEHVLLILDGAGWHKSKRLRVPANITLGFLPPYSPELNPVELVWLWLSEHRLSNRTFADQKELDDACIDAWNSLSTAHVKPLCSIS